MQDSHAFWKTKIITAPPPKKTKAVKPRGGGCHKKQTIEELLELDESEYNLTPLVFFSCNLLMLIPVRAKWRQARPTYKM